MTGHTDGAHLIPQHHFRQGSINWVCESAQSGGVQQRLLQAVESVLAVARKRIL